MAQCEFNQINENAVFNKSTNFYELDSESSGRSEIELFKKYDFAYENLSSLEKDVLAIAKTILKKKKFQSSMNLERIESISPIIEQLLEKCVAKMTYTKGISREQIFETIQSLESKRWIVTGQRRTLHEVVNTPMHVKILTLINNHPGIHARSPEIENELGITRTPFLKHVMILEAFGLVRSKKIGGSLNFFIEDVPETFDELIVMFSTPIVYNLICEYLVDAEQSVSSIAKKFEVYHGTIQYHLKKFVAEGIFKKQGRNFEVNIELLEKYNQFGYNAPYFQL